MIEWKRLFYMNGNQKGTGTVILTSAKLDFKKKKNFNKSQRMTLYKSINSPRRYSHYKYYKL